MPEQKFEWFSEQELKSFNLEKIEELLKKIEELEKFKIPIDFKNFDIDWNSKLSEAEEKILNILSRNKNKINFIKLLIYAIKKNEKKLYKKNIFTEIIRNPVDIITKLTNETLPKNTNQLKIVWLEKIREFNKKYTNVCPNFMKDITINMEKFKKILSLFKQAEIELEWESKFTIFFNNLLNERLKNSKFSKEQKDEIKNKWKQKSKEIFNSLFLLLKDSNKSCWFELAKQTNKKINEFLDKNKINKLNETERINLAWTISKTHQKITKYNFQNNEDEIKILQDQVKLTLKDKVELQKLLTLRSILIKNEKKADRVVITSQTTDKEIKEFDELIKKWATKEEAYNNFKTKKDLNIYNLSEEEYIKTNLGFEIKTPDWKILIISEKEKLKTKNNPEALKNLINFHDFFIKINMPSVWEYRNELIKWLWDITIDLDENAIDKYELIKIWNRLLDFINNSKKGNLKKNKSEITNLWWIRNKLIKFTWANSHLNDKKTVNSYWDDPFKALLREKLIIWDWFFKYEEFRKILNWNK